MKILFISDIHGIIQNLDRIKYLEEKCNFDKIVNLGDIYNCSSLIKNLLTVNPTVVKNFLNKFKSKLLTLKGNCDSNNDLEISALPKCKNIAVINVDNLNIYCTHGDYYNIDRNSQFNAGGVLIYGHFHIPYIKKKNNMTYVCVGSVSLPRDKYGPTYAIYENRKITIYSLIDNSIIFESEV